MVHAARIGGRALRVGRPVLVREHGDEAAVAGVEVEVALVLVVEVRLLEDEWHAEHALPEVDRRAPVGPDERDVVHALALELPHGRSTSLSLYSLRSRLPHGTSSTCVETTSTLRMLSRIAAASDSPPSAPRASSTVTGSGGSCLTPAARGRTRIAPLTCGAKAPTTSRIADGKTF